MRNNQLKSLICITLILLMIFPRLIFAEDQQTWDYTNSSTGFAYRLHVEDEDIFTQEERNILLEMMEPLTAYSHLIISVVTENPYYNSADYPDGKPDYKPSYLYNQAVKDSFTANKENPDNIVVLLLDLDTRYFNLEFYGQTETLLSEEVRENLNEETLSRINDASFYDGASYFCVELGLAFLDAKYAPIQVEVSTEKDNTSTTVSDQIQSGKNDTTGYQAIVLDQAGLFTEAEINRLYKDIYELTEKTNVVIATTNRNPYGFSEYSTEYEYKYCSDLYDRYFEAKNGEYENAVIFLIDMDTRWLYLYREGAVKKQLTEGTCDSITDNVYSYASSKEYVLCAEKTMEYVVRVLNNQRIAQPMKVISNVLIALVLAFFFTYLFAKSKSKAKSKGDSELLKFAIKQYENGIVRDVHTNTTKTYHPRSSSSGGGSRGGGGGGHHGGGGGHRF